LLIHLGIGAPAGALGADLDIAPVDFFALRVGAGISFGGPQLAVLPRMRAPLGKGRFVTFGAGPSWGRYVNASSFAGLGCLALCALAQNGESPATQTWQRAVWYNFELGFDVYSLEDTGLIRSSLGYGTIHNDHDYSCQERPYGYAPNAGCDRSSGHGLVYLTVEFGFVL